MLRAARPDLRARKRRTTTAAAAIATLSLSALGVTLAVPALAAEPCASGGVSDETELRLAYGAGQAVICLEPGFPTATLIGSLESESETPMTLDLNGQALTIDGGDMSVIAGPGIVVSVGMTLTIIDSDGAGTLVATGGDGQPGIGSGAPGTIKIAGGTITATGGGNSGAGIGGGGLGSSGGIVEISGGDVTAIGAPFAAGIGGGEGGGGDGVGGAEGGHGGTVSITGGTVTATGGLHGAGIGGGYGGDGADVTISGGTVTATGGMAAAGIGGGGAQPNGGAGGTVEITGGTRITATGGVPGGTLGGGAAIGAGGSSTLPEPLPAGTVTIRGTNVGTIVPGTAGITGEGHNDIIDNTGGAAATYSVASDTAYFRQVSGVDGRLVDDGAGGLVEAPAEVVFEFLRSASLVVSKLVDGAGAATAGATTYAFTAVCSLDGVEVYDDALEIVVTDVADGGEATIPSLPEGTSCVVTETGDGGADATTVATNGGVAQQASSAEITIGADSNAVVFTNSFEAAPLGSITISKVVSNATWGPAGPFPMTVTCTAPVGPNGAEAEVLSESFALADDESVTFDVADGADCSVTETNSFGADIRYLSTSSEIDGSVLVDGESAVRVTNVFERTPTAPPTTVTPTAPPTTVTPTTPPTTITPTTPGASGTSATAGTSATTGTSPTTGTSGRSGQSGSKATSTPSSSASRLASTGSNALTGVGVASVALALGALLLVVRRRFAGRQ